MHEMSHEVLNERQNQSALLNGGEKRKEKKTTDTFI